MAELIGRGRCPLCASDRARFSVSIKQLCCMTCDSCNSQIFSRSDRSDEKLRALIAPAPAPAPAAAPAAEKKPAPAAQVIEEPKPKKGFLSGVFD